MTTKTYKKFATAAATSALVASAVVPVAAAVPQAEVAETSYSDVPVSSAHYANIIKARELGIMTGYPNGTFQPDKTLNRGDVTKALGKFVVEQSGMTQDEYVEEFNISSVENFNDVPDDYVDSELLTYSKIVKDAGVFQGSENNLMPTKQITRDQMAEVLVRAFEFEDQPEETNIEDAEKSAYAKSIEILYENGITNQNPYRPLESTSRAQFATFLVRAYDAIVGEVEEPAPEEEPGLPAIVSVEFGEDEISESPVALSSLFDVNGISLTTEGNISIGLVDGTPTIYVETGTEADGYQEGDVLLGTIEAVSESFTDLSFIEQDGNIYLTGFSEGDNGTFTLEVRNGENVIATNEVTVSDIQAGEEVVPTEGTTDSDGTDATTGEGTTETDADAATGEGTTETESTDTGTEEGTTETDNTGTATEEETTEPENPNTTTEEETTVPDSTDTTTPEGTTEPEVADPTIEETPEPENTGDSTEINQ